MLYIEKEREELYYNFCILDLINIILRMFTIYPMTTGAHSQQRDLIILSAEVGCSRIKYNEILKF